MSDLFVSDLNELLTPAGTDIMHVRRNSDTADPDKRMALDKLAFIGAAQAFTAMQTFNAGIQFGGTPKATLNNYTLAQSYTPVMTASVSNPTITYNGQAGLWARFGAFILYQATVSWSAISGGSGNVQISLPLPVGPGPNWGAVIGHGINWQGGTIPVAIVPAPIGGQSFATITLTMNNAPGANLQVTALAAFQFITLNGLYQTP